MILAAGPTTRRRTVASWPIVRGDLPPDRARPGRAVHGAGPVNDGPWSGWGSARRPLPRCRRRRRRRAAAWVGTSGYYIRAAAKRTPRAPPRRA
eukprot:scaffold4030_cov202-Prasinococcus_capsulatus_cf.AAC.1